MGSHTHSYIDMDIGVSCSQHDGMPLGSHDMHGVAARLHYDMNRTAVSVNDHTAKLKVCLV